MDKDSAVAFLRMQHRLYERATVMAGRSENAFGIAQAYGLSCLRDAAKEVLEAAETEAAFRPE